MREKDYEEAILRRHLANNSYNYIAVVESTINWYESCKSEAEAVQLLRDLVEADGHHVFIKHFPVNYGNGYYERNLIYGKVMWFNTITRKTETKRIRVEGLKPLDIKELQELRECCYQKKYLEWVALHEGEY